MTAAGKLTASDLITEAEITYDTAKQEAATGNWDTAEIDLQFVRTQAMLAIAIELAALHDIYRGRRRR